MIAKMLHLSQEKNKILLESDVQSTKAHTAEYKIDNRTVNDILDQICKDTDLIHMSNSISPRGMVKGHILPAIQGGCAQIMSLQQLQKLSWLHREKKEWN